MITISKYNAGGKKVTIRLQSLDIQEVERWAWFFENFGAIRFPIDTEIEREIDELPDGVYQLSFTVPATKVISAFANSKLLRLSDRAEYKGVKQGALPDARDEATWRFANLPVFTPTRYDTAIAEFAELAL